MLRHRRRMPPRQRKEERELFFWTAHEAIRLAVSLALAVYLVLALATGSNPVLHWLLQGI